MTTSFKVSPLLVPFVQVSDPVVDGVRNSDLPPNLHISDPNVGYTRHKYHEIFCESCHEFSFVPVYCGNRFCPTCTYGRQARIRSRIRFMLRNVPHFNTHGVKFLTLTIKNMNDLPKMIRILLQSFRKLRSTKYWKRHVLGGAFVIEITGYPGNWHAHIHAILQAKFMARKDLIVIWTRISKSWNLDIRNIPKSKAIGYLTKYITKSDVSVLHQFTVSSALKGSRLFSPFGTWYAISNQYVQPLTVCRCCKEPALTLASYIFTGKYQSPTWLLRSRDAPEARRKGRDIYATCPF